MKLKKKNSGEENKQEDGIREKVEALRKKEEEARRAEKIKYLPDKRNLTVIITAVLCFLIVVGGIYMVSRLRQNNNNNTNNLDTNSSVTTVGSISSDKAETEATSGQTENSTDSSPVVEIHDPEVDNPGYHPIERPDVSPLPVNPSVGEVSTSTTSPVTETEQSESSSLGVEDIDVGSLFH